MQGRLNPHDLAYVEHGKESEAELGSKVESLRRVLYATEIRAELEELETDLASLEALEGLSSADLAAGVARGELTITKQRAWWLARWRLHERLRVRG